MVSHETTKESPLSWPWFITLLVLWAMTVLGWMWHVTVIRSGRSDKTAPAATTDYLKQVKKACKGNDPKKVYQSVMHWGRQQYGQAFSLRQLKTLLNSDAATVLAQLERASYADGGASWTGCDQLVTQLKQLEQAKPVTVNGLAPLYPS